ncbi:MAG: hypothetical protein AAF916_01945 [Planctomycetota bacterium]
MLVLVSPWLLSKGPGNALVIRVINSQIPGNFTADKITLGWLGGVGLRSGELRDPEGGVVLNGLDVSADGLGLLDLLNGSGFGEIVVVVENVSVEQPAEGPSNLQRSMRTASGQPSTSNPSSTAASDFTLPINLNASLKLTARRVVYATVSANGLRDETILTDLDTTADLSNPSRIEARATSRLERDGVSGVFDADVALIDAVDGSGSIDWRNGGIELVADVLELPIEPLDRLLEADGVLAASIGERLSASVTAKGTVAAPEATIAVRSPFLGFDASLRRNGESVQIVPGAVLTWRLTPDAFAKLQGKPAEPAVLADPVDILVPLESLTIPVGTDGVAIERTSGRVEATWSPVSIALPDGRVVGVRGGALRADTASIGERVSLALATDTSVARVGMPDSAREDRVVLTLAVMDLLPESASSDRPGVGLDIELEKLPVALIEALAAIELPGAGLPSWIGPEISVDAELRLPAKDNDPLRATGRIRSAGLNGPFDLSVQPDGLSGELSTPEPIAMRFDRETLLAAVGPDAWFASPVGLRSALEPELIFRDVRWRLMPAAVETDSMVPDEEAAAVWETTLARLDPACTSGQIEFMLPSLLLQDHRRDRPLPELRGLRASVAVSELSRPVEAVLGVSFDGPALDDGKTADGGVTARISASALLNPRGDFDPMQGVFDLTLRGTAVPSAVVDAFTGQEGRLAATLGPSIEPELSAKLRPGRDASLEIDVVSTHAVGSVLMAEDLSDDVWRPVLEEDPRFTLAISREAVESWMGRLHPVFADVVRSAPDAPAKLSLDRSSFELSDQGFFDLEGIRARATLDLGKLELERQGWLRQGIVGAVRQFAPGFQRDRAGASYVAQFSPMRITIDGGVVRTSELWLTSTDMGMGFAGMVDLNTNRIDMGLGVLGATFIAAGSDFEKVLEPLKVYELPVRGTIAEPTIEFDKFLGQVAAAYGQRELERNADKLGDWGAIISVIGGAVVAEALQWENSRAWTPSGEAQAFAVGIANPEPAVASEELPETPVKPGPAQANTPPEDSPADPEPRDEVGEVLRGILDIIGQQQER